jgi:hypothetical protein
MGGYSVGGSVSQRKAAAAVMAGWRRVALPAGSADPPAVALIFQVAIGLRVFLLAATAFQSDWARRPRCRPRPVLGRWLF